MPAALPASTNRLCVSSICGLELDIIRARSIPSSPRSSVSARAISPSTSSIYGNFASATALDRSRTSARTATPLRENSRTIADPLRPAAPVTRIMPTSHSVTCAAAASDERGTYPVPPSHAALHCRCREVRVLGLKKTVGAEVFDLVLVERHEHLMEVVQAIRAPDDLRQAAHQLALPVDWEASGASNLDEDPGMLGLHGPFLAARDFEHRRVTDIIIGHLVDVHAVVGHLVRLVEDVQRSLDQLLLGSPCESRRTQDGDYGHGYFSFVCWGFPIPFKVRANALRSPTNRSGSSIAAK